MGLSIREDYDNKPRAKIMETGAFRPEINSYGMTGLDDYRKEAYENKGGRTYPVKKDFDLLG